jgi:hypothetical protein
MPLEADQGIKCGFPVTFFQKVTSVLIKARILIDFKERRYGKLITVLSGRLRKRFMRKRKGM